MTPLSFFSTHTGANGSGCGAIAAGLVDVGGIEIEPYPVQLYRQNFGSHIRHESILDTPIEQLPDFDFLWSSPVCCSFSTAKTDGAELQLDIDNATKVAEIISKKKPRWFALENVRGYLYKPKENPKDADKFTESFGRIHKALESCGYNIHFAIYDSADYGVPQNRHRLILRASRDPLGNLPQTHSKTGGLWWKLWNGWYDAVADLLPTCKQSHLTERQIQALENKGGDLRSVLVEGKSHSGSMNVARLCKEPSNTVVAGVGHQNRAVIIERTGYGHDRDPIVRESTEPSQTIRASVGCDEKGGYRSPITALLESADVRALDYRCLARLQSFKDTYLWGDSSGKNCRAIGNAVPPLLAQRVIESIIL